MNYGFNYDISQLYHVSFLNDSNHSDYRFGKTETTDNGLRYRVDTIFRDNVKTKVVVREVRDTTKMIRRDTIRVTNTVFEKTTAKSVLSYQELFIFLSIIIVLSLLFFQLKKLS